MASIASRGSTKYYWPQSFPCKCHTRIAIVAWTRPYPEGPRSSGVRRRAMSTLLIALGVSGSQVTAISSNATPSTSSECPGIGVSSCCSLQKKCSIFSLTSGKVGRNVLGTNTGTLSSRVRDLYDGKPKPSAERVQQPRSSDELNEVGKVNIGLTSGGVGGVDLLNSARQLHHHSRWRRTVLHCNREHSRDVLVVTDGNMPCEPLPVA